MVDPQGASALSPVLPLAVHDLCHAYGPVGVLDGVSFEVGPGEVVALLGPSGVGKTTLLRAIAGLLTADSGRVELGGRCVVADGIEQVPTERRKVGLLRLRELQKVGVRCTMRAELIGHT